MIRLFTEELEIFDARADNQAAFTATNATNTFTSAGHGLANGNAVTVANSGGALPTGLSASTYYYVISADTNTFQLSTTPGGSAVAISDDGTGTHTWYQEFEGKRLLVADYKSIIIAVHTSGSTSGTLFTVGSIMNDAPTFLNPQSESVRYSNLALIDLATILGVQGATGISISGTDINNVYKVNVDGVRWFTVKTRDFQAGQLTIKALGLHE